MRGRLEQWRDAISFHLNVDIGLPPKQVYTPEELTKLVLSQGSIIVVDQQGHDEVRLCRT